MLSPSSVLVLSLQLGIVPEDWNTTSATSVFGNEKGRHEE